MSQERQVVQQYTLARRPASHQAAHIRSRRIALICLALALYVATVLFTISTLLSGEHWWGVGAQRASIQGQAWQITWVDSVGLASNENIQPGNIVQAINGHPPQSENDINRANTLTLSQQDGKTQTISWQTPGPLDNILSLSWFILGTVSLLLGLLIFLHATDRSLAPRFFLLWTAMALVSSLEPATAFGNLLAAHAAAVLSVGVLVGLLANFLWLLLFPSSSRAPVADSQQPLAGRPKRPAGHRWLPEIPVVTGLLVACFFLYTVNTQQQDLLNTADALIYGQTALAICLSLFFILRASLYRRASITRERARTLLGGMILGLTPLLALTVIPELISGPPLVPGQISALAAITLPLAFAYAIVRRDLLRVDSLIRNTALGVLGVIGTLILAVLLAQALNLLPTVPALIIGIIAGAIFTPLIWVGARWITEAWLFPQVRHYRKLIAQGESIERTGLDPLRIVGQLVGEVHLALPVRQVAVFVPDQHTGRLISLPVPQSSNKPGEHAAALSQPKGAVALVQTPQPRPQEYTILPLDNTLYSRLSSREGGAVLVEPAPLEQRRESSPAQERESRAAVSPLAPGNEASQTPGAQLDKESWHLLVPMRVRGRLVGILALSRREDDQAYSDTDVRLLRLLAGRRALALDYALLYADLHTAFEKRQEIDRLKDQFIVTAHHELRTPLTGVQGYLELLRELGPEGRALRPQEVTLFIERACHSADELNEQLDSLLAAAETDIMQEQLQQRPVELGNVAQRAIQTLDAQAQRGHHRVRNQIPTDLVGIGDPEALYRIFMNLLSNAFKYSPEGRPVLFEGRTRLVSASMLPGATPTEGDFASGGHVPVAEILVRDWGMGIDRRDKEKIFERFIRLERDLNSPVRGSGLGLAICKELVEAMGGSIDVESDGQGLGSTFFIRLPLAEAPVASKLFADWEDR